jgi:hypothetical protein
LEGNSYVVCRLGRQGSERSIVKQFLQRVGNDHCKKALVRFLLLIFDLLVALDTTGLLQNEFLDVVVGVVTVGLS